MIIYKVNEDWFDQSAILCVQYLLSMRKHLSINDRNLIDFETLHI